MTNAPLRTALLVLSLCCALVGCSALGGSDTENDEVRWDTDVPDGADFDAVAGAWGPDGKRIAFQHTPHDSARETGDRSDQLWIANLETGERRMVFPGTVLNIDWSPDGEWFVFHTRTDPEFLYKVRSDGTDLTRLTGPGSLNPDLEYTTHGRWSPNGERILFTIVAGEPRGNSVMKPDGSEARIVVPYGISGSWFPDGERFVYANWDTTQSLDRSQQLYSAEINGSKIKKITDVLDSEHISQPNVSPTEEQIAFSYDGQDGSDEIYLMDTNGKNIRQVTQGPGLITGTKWSPDGERILFSRFIPNVSDRLYLLDVETLEVEPVFPIE